MVGIIDLMSNVQGGFDKGRERGQQSYLGRLASQAYGAAPDQQRGYVQQAIATNPEAGFSIAGALEKSRQTDFSQLGQAAAIMSSMPEDQRADFYASRVVPLAHQSGFKVPTAYDPRFQPMIDRVAQVAGNSGGSDDLKSLRIGANGNYWAIRGGQFVDTGTPAAPTNQVIDTGNGFFGVDKRTLSAAPVMVGGQQSQQQPQQRAPGEVPFSIDPSLPPQVQAAIRSNPSAGSVGGISDLAEVGGAQGQQLRSAPDGITPYQQQSLDLQRDRLSAARDARDQATAARKVADEAKAEQKRQVDLARQAEAATAANTLVSAIDELLMAPGYSDLGTPTGDLKIATPLIRNDAKDADAQLKNIGGQVALSTMARLKALSSQGATGFGALSAPELKLLQNAIATLQSEDISNAQLTRSLRTIRDTVDKVATWQPQAGTATASGSAESPQSNSVLRYNPATGDFE